MKTVTLGVVVLLACVVERAVARKVIDDEAVRLMASLKGQIDTYTAKDYLSARKFIDSLKYEAKFAPAVMLAARK